MIEKFFVAINWMDVVLFIIVARIIYIGIQQGFVIEGFKLLGLILATFVTLHYYTKLGSFLNTTLNLLPEWANVVSFGTLWILVVVVFKFIRDGFLVLINMQAHPVLDKWGGFFVSLFRAGLVGSLTVLMLLASQIPYLQNHVEHSLTGRWVIDIAPNVYRGFFHSSVKNFFPNEQLNDSALQLRNEGK